LEIGLPGCEIDRHGSVFLNDVPRGPEGVTLAKELSRAGYDTG